MIVYYMEINMCLFERVILKREPWQFLDRQISSKATDRQINPLYDNVTFSINF